MRRLRLPWLAAVLGAALLWPVAPAGAEDPAKGQAGPLRLETGTYDFGICEQNREYAAEVAYTNAGEAPLRDIRVQSDCGCYAASLSARELAPGAGGTVKIRFRTLTFTGLVRKRLKIVYDDGAVRTATLEMRLNIFGGILLRPGRLHFGEILAGTMPEAGVSVVYYEGVGKPFEVVGVDVAGQPIETRVEAIEPPAKPPPEKGKDPPLKKEDRWRGWRIHFRFTRPPAKGVYSERAVVTTTSPETPRIVVPLTAHVVGKVWVQTHRISLGLVPQGETRSAWVNFRPFSPDIELGTVSARSRKGILRATVEQAFGSRGPVQRLRVTIPADAPEGALDDVIELRTQVPGEEVTEIEVRGRIFKRTG
jgi:hypothetical protein